MIIVSSFEEGECFSYKKNMLGISCRPTPVFGDAVLTLDTYYVLLLLFFRLVTEFGVELSNSSEPNNPLILLSRYSLRNIELRINLFQNDRDIILTTLNMNNI